MCCHDFYIDALSPQNASMSDIVAAFDLIIGNHASTVRLGV